MQSTNRVLMISPTCFEVSLPACDDNQFMGKRETSAEVKARILTQHAQWVDLLRQNGITVELFEHTAETPDACFPNNWFVSHRVLTYFPMRVPNRRLERRADLKAFLEKLHDAHLPPIDLSDFEQQDKFLEGTGSMVIDWQKRVVFAALSQRTHLDVVRAWVAQLSSRLGTPFRSVTFSASHKEAPMYHTNVMMCIGSKFVVCALSAIDKVDRQRVVQESSELGKIVVEISPSQVDALCGNILELDTRLLIMSSRSFEAFSADQKRVFEQECGLKIVHSSLDDLEEHGGGGIRCCIAELFAE